jgi:hypothetical protein
MQITSVVQRHLIVGADGKRVDLPLGCIFFPTSPTGDSTSNNIHTLILILATTDPAMASCARYLTPD